jgi:hypothetical protein
MQPLPVELGNSFPPGSEERRKFEKVYAGTDRTYTLAKKYKLKTAWGTDVLFFQALAQRQGALRSADPVQTRGRPLSWRKKRVEVLHALPG